MERDRSFLLKLPTARIALDRRAAVEKDRLLARPTQTWLILRMDSGRETRGLPLAQLRPSLLPGEKMDFAAHVSGHNPLPGPDAVVDVSVAV